VDPDTGIYVRGQYKTYALAGAVRSMGEADDSINRLSHDDKILHKVFHA